MTCDVDIPDKFFHIFAKRSRYRVWYGGRGSGKSWGIARALLVLALQKKVRVLCTRNYQVSIADSSHRLLSDQIKELKLESYFKITKSEIRASTGSFFIFRGLQNPADIKSLEGINVCWVEEAEKISEEALDFLTPTIRAENSEIWFSFNPYAENDPIMKRFIYNKPDNAIVTKINWHDNPWFPDVLKKEMEYDKRTNPDRYNWVWLGEPRGLSDAQVFRGKFEIQTFGNPDQGTRFYFGADWGFAQDPTTLVRCVIVDRKLYIDYEAYGIGVDIDETPQLFSSVPGSREGIIYSDCARPETISYMNKNGWPNVKPAKKWQGSVEDGIEFIKSFEKIIIHERCKKTIEEFNLYQYKKDKTTNEVLPVIVDKNNHIIDACRYSLDKLITGKKSAFVL